MYGLTLVSRAEVGGPPRYQRDQLGSASVLQVTFEERLRWSCACYLRATEPWQTGTAELNGPLNGQNSGKIVNDFMLDEGIQDCQSSTFVSFQTRPDSTPIEGDVTSSRGLGNFPFSSVEGSYFPFFFFLQLWVNSSLSSFFFCKKWDTLDQGTKLCSLSGEISLIETYR